jgi:glycosyltransferase involved in cell wall biosynthesis
MNGRCDVSVVISTYNRSHDLEVALDGVLSQRGAVSYEVIVVDNNSTDDTARIVRSRVAAGERRLRYVFEPKQGLPFGRNAGVRAARAPLIAFTDDDVKVDEGWVAAIKRAFDEHPDVDALGGRILPCWPGDVPEWLRGGPAGPLALNDRGPAIVEVGASNAATCLTGANMAFRRSVFDRIGPFATDFLRNEDRELQLRLWEVGGRGLYYPAAIVHVDVPVDRMTKAYFRFWHRAAGRFHSRMRLLERIDRNNRMVSASAHRTALGVPLFVYRQLLQDTARWIIHWGRRQERQSFLHELRARYLASYITERLAERGALRVAPPPPLTQRSA